MTLSGARLNVANNQRGEKGSEQEHSKHTFRLISHEGNPPGP